MNFLHVSSFVVVPSYGTDADEVVLTTLAAIFPQQSVKSLDRPAPRKTRRTAELLHVYDQWSRAFDQF